MQYIAWISHIQTLCRYLNILCLYRINDAIVNSRQKTMVTSMKSILIVSDFHGSASVALECYSCPVHERPNQNHVPITAFAYYAYA